ncbi:MAG: thiamine-phosphate kinase [Chitinispirillales bacterium]|nr:thiamine-phosphate kinase [Chitinispirillales bacterium]
MNKFPSKEYELIRRIQAVLPPVNRHSSQYEVMIGDDAAIRVNRTAGERLIITADVSVENVHFSTDTTTFEETGYRAMASNLSDCAAMGAKPDGAVVQLVFPKRGVNNAGIDDINGAIEQIYAGFSKACRRWNFPLVGGDLSGGGVWTIGITLIGSAPPGRRLLKRTGVIDGDALWVTGLPGESAAGLAALTRWGRGGVPPRYNRFVEAHITPQPAVDEGLALAAAPFVHAMMDLSDGLSKDVATLCFDNNLGFIFDADAEKSVPRIMMGLADELQTDFREWFYHGGEEYELLFACDPSVEPRGICVDVDNIAKSRPNITRLGHFTSETRDVLIRGADGNTEELRMKSWDHFK